MEEKKDSSNFKIGCAIVVILFIIIPMLFGLVGRCMGNHNPAPWEEGTGVRMHTD